MYTQEDYPAAEKSWQRKAETLLYFCCPTEVEYFSSLLLPQLFCRRIVFLSFHPFLVSVLFPGLSLLVQNFIPKIFTLGLCSFLAA